MLLYKYMILKYNLILKVSRFLHDLQVNVLLTKIFLVLESFVN